MAVLGQNSKIRFFFVYFCELKLSESEKIIISIMCDSNSWCATPLWGRGGDFTLFEKIISDVPRAGVDTHGDVTRVGAEESGDVTRVGAEESGDVTRGGAEASGDVPTPSPQGGGAP